MAKRVGRRSRGKGKTRKGGMCDFTLFIYVLGAGLTFFLAIHLLRQLNMDTVTEKYTQEIRTKKEINPHWREYRIESRP